MFYDATGAVLDMLVTHLFQVAAEVAMEPPASLGAARPAGRPGEGHRAASGRWTRPRSCSASSTATGTYPGSIRNSSQDTFVAARMWIDNARWRGVPFYLRTGKRLAATQAAGQPDPARAARAAGRAAAHRDERAVLLAGRATARSTCPLVAKKPGPALALDAAHASIPLSGLPGADPLPPYVRLIHDVLIGDRSLFTRPDGLAAVWKVAEPLLANPPKVVPYAPGSWGPAQARKLIAPGRWLLGQ